MATLPRNFSTSEKPESNGREGAKIKKSKRLSWTLTRKKTREEAFVEDGSGEEVATLMLVGCVLYA